MKKIRRFKPGVMKRRYYKMVRHFQETPYKRKDGEWHHVMPVSMGGSNRTTNLVRVPSRVHFILHWILTRLPMDVGHQSKMRQALWRMMNPQTRQHRRSYTFTSKHYAKVRRWQREYMRDHNPMYDPKLSRRMIVDNPMHRPEVLALFVGRKRPNQSAVMQRVNAKRWAKRPHTYTCGHCRTSLTVQVTKQTRIKENWCCGKSCYYYFKYPDRWQYRRGKQR